MEPYALVCVRGTLKCAICKSKFQISTSTLLPALISTRRIARQYDLYLKHSGKAKPFLLSVIIAGNTCSKRALFCYVVVGPPNPDNLPEDGKLKSEVMIKDNRRYYLDLKENQRGRFLRVSRTEQNGIDSASMSLFSFYRTP